MDTRPAPHPRAVVAAGDEAVREFLVVHLARRGFAVERAHRPEYLRLVSAGADVLFADLEELEAAGLAPEDRPAVTFALTCAESAEDARRAALAGADACLKVPFQDPPTLASTLDLLARHAVERARCTAPEPVGAL